MKVLEKILLSSNGGSFEGKLAATISWISVCAIFSAYLLIYIYFALKLEYGFIRDPRVFYLHLFEFSDIFNSLTIIIMVTLVSITSMIPGLAAIFYGLLGRRKTQNMIIAFCGLVGFCVGAINFYIVLTICAPS